MAAAFERLRRDHSWAPGVPERPCLLVAGATRAEAEALAAADGSPVAEAILGDSADKSAFRPRLAFLGSELFGDAPSSTWADVVWETGSAEAALPSMLAADPAFAPDAVFAFMPGFWGYASWEAGSRALSGLGAPVVSTAYSIEECEDDEDSLRGWLGTGRGLSLLWEAELTPGGVASPRQFGTCPATGRALFENAAWLATRCRTAEGEAGAT